MFDGEGRIAAVRNTWTFDEMFSAFAIEGMDRDGDGQYSAAELGALAEENIASLADFGFFTRLTSAEQELTFDAPTKYGGTLAGSKFVLSFELPLREPITPSVDLSLAIADPQYYVTLDFAGENALRLVGAPPSCKSTLHPPKPADQETMALLSMLTPDQRELPPALKEAASRLGSRATFDCG